MERWGLLLLMVAAFAADGHVYNELTALHNGFVHGYFNYSQDLELSADTDYPIWEPGDAACPLSSTQALHLAQQCATNLIEGLVIDQKQRCVSLVKRADYWFYDIQLGLSVTNGTPRARSKPITIAVGLNGTVPKFKKHENTVRRFGEGFRRSDEPDPKTTTKLTPEEQAKKREEVRANLMQYQMEVIRAGMPPMPIPLTQDMDDRLVEEGYLSPLEIQDPTPLNHSPIAESWTNSIPGKRPKSGITKD